mmetsp:Transcript_11239/g.22992  ORF Transcript_11239/g.22992 Transcript_11239/m.22992 type:complete len:171 (-) Transcript_11239:263-775(-)
MTSLSYTLSSLHACLAIAFAAVFLPLYLNELAVNPLGAASSCWYECTCTDKRLWIGVYIMCSVMIGYFIIDLFLMRSSGMNAIFAFHHIAFGFAGILQLAYGRSCGPFVWLISGELSTIFLNARWFFRRKENVDAYTIAVVELLFASTFFITRIIGYGIGLYYCEMNQRF